MSLELDFPDVLALVLASVALVVSFLSWRTAVLRNRISLHNDRVRLYRQFRDAYGKFKVGAKDKSMSPSEQVEYLDVLALSEFYFSDKARKLLEEGWRALSERDEEVGVTGDYQAVLPLWNAAEAKLEEADGLLRKELRKVR